MPTDTENVKFLLLCMENGGGGPVDHAAVAATLNITTGASNKRLKRLRIASEQGKSSDKAAVEFLYQCYKTSKVGKIDHKVVGEIFDLKPGASSKRLSRLKKALEEGNYSGTVDKEETTGITSAKGKEKKLAGDDDGAASATKLTSSTKRKRATAANTDDDEETPTMIKHEKSDDGTPSGRKKPSTTQKQSANKKQKTDTNKSETELDTKPKSTVIKREEEDQAKLTTAVTSSDGYEADNSSGDDVDTLGVPTVPPNTAVTTALPTPSSMSENTGSDSNTASQANANASYGNPPYTGTVTGPQIHPNATYTAKAHNAYTNTAANGTTYQTLQPRPATTGKKAAYSPNPSYPADYIHNDNADPRKIDYPKGANSVYPRRHSLADAFRSAQSEHSEPSEHFVASEMDAQQLGLQEPGSLDTQQGDLQYMSGGLSSQREMEDPGFFNEAFAASRVVVGGSSSEDEDEYV